LIECGSGLVGRDVSAMGMLLLARPSGLAIYCSQEMRIFRNFDVRAVYTHPFLLMIVGHVLAGSLSLIQMILLLKTGQSIGKGIVGIRVVGVSDTTVPGFVKIVLLRTLVPWALAGIPHASVSIWLADTLFIFREDRRCAHDLIAQTRVIKI